MLIHLSGMRLEGLRVDLPRINGLDLFSGIGGLSIALRQWVRTVAYCEKDRYAQGVLLSRMRDGSLDRAPIWDDITTLQGKWLPEIDIIFGGFPCQPYSSAARGRNRHDTLKTDFVRIVQQVAPVLVFAENVGEDPIEDFCESLKEIGYKTKTLSNTAADVGAPFIGRRYWAIASTDRKSKPTFPLNEKVAVMPPLSKNLWGDDEPQGLRVSDGIPNRMDRARCLGNAVVPLQAKAAFEILCGIKS